MASGWVYVLSNTSLPEQLKVGFTTKSPELRARELSNTSLPTRFVVEYAVHVDQPATIEKRIHRALKKCNVGKEFFRVTLDDAQAAVDKFSIGHVIGSPGLAQTQINARLQREEEARTRKQEEARRQEDLVRVRQSHFKALIISNAYQILCILAQDSPELDVQVAAGERRIRKEVRVSIWDSTRIVLFVFVIVLLLTGNLGAVLQAIWHLLAGSEDVSGILIILGVASLCILFLGWVYVARPIRTPSPKS